MWSARKGADSFLTVSCGRCIGCRVARARSWALRITHEAKLWPSNWFATLTYSDPPPGGSLHYPHFQAFMKRLRRRVPGRVRFFVVGEYGSRLSRPHFHACLFNLVLSDAKPLSLHSRSSSSALLEETWGHGFVQLDELNFSTASYAARYIFKKVTGDQADEHYQAVDADGVVHQLVPEHCRMSLRPGIGAKWFARFGGEFFRGDSIVHNGSQFGMPRYYDRLQKRLDAGILDDAREGRESKALKRDRSWRRLEAGAEIAEARQRMFAREFEE